MEDQDRGIVRLARRMGISAHKGPDGWVFASWMGNIEIKDDMSAVVVLLSGVGYTMLQDRKSVV